MEQPSIAKIAAALSKAQGKITGAKKDSTNPHFKSKYADLASIWDACRAALSENEIAVVQAPKIIDSQLYLDTTLMHSSGETIACTLPISVLVTAPAQQIGSAITYARRYSLASMVGVAPDDDDDGNAAQSTPPAPQKPLSFWERASYKLPPPASNDMAAWVASFRNGLAKAPDAKTVEKYQADNQDSIDMLAPTTTHELTEECAARSAQLQK